LRRKGFGRSRRQRFLRRRLLRHWPLLCPLLPLGAARFGRFFRNFDGLQGHHGNGSLLLANLLFGAEREQQEQQQRFDQEREGYSERASSSPGTEPFENRSGWNRTGLKQSVSLTLSAGPNTRGCEREE
jgi:hypothetical protein